ncbi:MAG: hypothetical protein H8F28_20810 [Fibrella sp.]|nr:hypothetical protein [Armatimonadota bacterium]
MFVTRPVRSWRPDRELFRDAPSADALRAEGPDGETPPALPRPARPLKAHSGTVHGPSWNGSPPDPNSTKIRNVVS